jgi:hypothetical protein
VIERHGVEASSTGPSSSNKRKKRGKGAAHGNSSHRAAGSGRGRYRCPRQNSMKAKTNRVFLDSKSRGGGSEDLPPNVTKLFQEGRYSPSTGMEMSEWQIILE